MSFNSTDCVEQGGRGRGGMGMGEGIEWEGVLTFVFMELFSRFYLNIATMQTRFWWFIFSYLNLTWLIRSGDSWYVPKETFPKMLYNSIQFWFAIRLGQFYVGYKTLWRSESWEKLDYKEFSELSEAMYDTSCSCAIKWFLSMHVLETICARQDKYCPQVVFLVLTQAKGN